MCKMNSARILSALIAMLMLASCQAEPDKAEATSSDTTVTEAPETTSYLETIQAYDFGGDTIRLMVNSAGDRPNLHAGEENGEIINDAMFNRDRTVSELFNCEIGYTAYDDRSKLYKDLTRLISAGEDSCDIIITSLMEGVGNLSVSGMTADLNSLDALNLDAEWWCQSMNETMKTGNKIYAASGPMALCYCYSPYAFFTNLNMAEDFGLESVYTLVESGNWTIDTMNSMMKDIYEDVNSNGKVDSGDRFPLTVTLESGKAFYIGCGMRMARKTSDGAELYMDSPQSVDVLDLLNSIMKPDEILCTDNLATSWMPGVSDYKTAMFTNSQALFCAAPIQWSVLYFRDMADDYAILPYPKYDASQDEYYSHINSYFPVGIAIPVTCQRADETAAVMEALAYISQTEMLPKINDVVLKEKVARDENSKQMIDLLYKNMIVDLNSVFDFAGSATMLRKYAVGESENFSSSYAAIKTRVETELNNMLEKLS